VRALEPDETGLVRGVHWERFGDGDPTVLFVPAWAIVHSRIWKMQVPYFARHFRVVTFDPRGNGLSERPAGPGAYS
jgi:pimeloyl-ACP methyl ester carboxylesterase